MNNTIKTLTVQFRITEKLNHKIEELESSTGRKRSDLFRQAIEILYDEDKKKNANPYYGGSTNKKEFKYEKSKRIMDELMGMEDKALSLRLKELGIFHAEWSKQFPDFTEFITRGPNNERIWNMIYGGSEATQSEEHLRKLIEKSDAFAALVKE